MHTLLGAGVAVLLDTSGQVSGGFAVLAMAAVGPPRRSLRVPLPVFRHGVAASLSSLGHLVEEPANAEARLRERPGGVVLLTLHSAEDLDRLTAPCRLRPRPLVVALASTDDRSQGVRAARSVVAREATNSALQRAVAAPLDGEAVMLDLSASYRGRSSRSRDAIPRRRQLS
ncbi:hypothetical protein [Streptomyces sp. NPDC050534]|uniref:hypothetical protein n=1 Tax=Streptomyces sp. NPDC050534 TaxID=3365625 RepID=UPI00379CA7D7